MHKHPAPAILLALLLAAATPPAAAQTDTHTADTQKKPTKPAPKTTKPAKPTQAAAKAAPSSPPPPPPPPPPVVPPAPPPVVVIPPPLDVPTRPQQAPPPVPILADAPGDVLPVPDGIRLTFGTGRADLNPATADAVRALARTAAPASTLAVTAFAAGAPDDPSTPRRLSLARALNVRALLISEGVVSTRINVRALGASQPASDAPADRVDLLVAAPPPTTAASAPAPATPNTPKTATP